MKIRLFYHFLILLVGGAIVFSSCKGKKKLTSVTDTAQVSQEIQKEVDTKTIPIETAKTEASTAVKLESYFSSIANAPSLTSANNSIQEAQAMFNSGDAPVLIIFYASGGKAEYDEPTTINKYLNYLKDTKKSINRVEDFTLDSSGKIKELVLFRK
ncbi:MAG: nucleoid-structuring protein H-NS [Bacteroidota bacterium]